MKDSNSCEHNIADRLTFLLIGGSIGAVLALLFAPKSGSKLRGDIAEVSRKGYDATLEKAHDLQRRSSDAIHTVKDKAESVYDFASGKLASGKEAVTEAVAEVAEAVADGLNRMQSEPDPVVKQTKNGQIASKII